jgi:chemotaxis protein MotA
VDTNSLIGLALALLALLGGQFIEGGKLSLFLQPAAMVIVLVGTLAAVLIQHPVSVFVRGVRKVRWVFHPPEMQTQSLINRVVAWAHIVRRDGLFSLETQLEIVSDPFIKRAMQMLIDGAEPGRLREVMDIEINAFELKERQSTRIWEAAGGYAPTMGIIGAVIGLIHVMQNLSDPSRLGEGIAVAFVATIYGVSLANLLFLPMANKLKWVTSQQIKERELLADGLECIARGDHPRLIELRLKAHQVEEDPRGRRA